MVPGRSLRRLLNARTWRRAVSAEADPEEGDFFKSGLACPRKRRPVTLRVYGGGSDYAVVQIRAITPSTLLLARSRGRMYLLDLWRKQASSDQWIESFCDMVLQWKPMAWAEEQGQIKSGRQAVSGSSPARAASVRLPSANVPTRGDKAVRAQSMRGRMALEGFTCPSVHLGTRTSEANC